MTGFSKQNVLTSNIVLLEHAERIRSVFALEKIPFLFIKGCAFLDTLYLDLSQRKMCDIDVLVPRENKKEAAKLLLANGYKQKPLPKGREETFNRHYNLAFELEACPKIVIELHTELCQKKQFNVDYESLFRRCVEYTTADRIVPTLSAEDSILSLVLHAVKESFHIDSLRLSDANLIVKEWKPDFSVILQRAKDYGFLFATKYYLKKMIDQFDVDMKIELSFTKLEKAKAVFLDKNQINEGESKLKRRLHQLVGMVLTSDTKKHLVGFFADYGIRRLTDGKRYFGAKNNE